MIEEIQRQLGDVIKALDTEVTDFIVALRLEVKKLAATVKVIMMAIGRSPLEGNASEHKGEVRVLDPRLDARESNAQKVEEFVNSME